MKKVLTLFIAIAMILSMSIASYAAADDFLVSPSTKPAPDLEDFENEDPDCTGEIKIIPYSDRDQLSDDDKKEFEDAYDSIVNADDLSDLNKDLKDDNLAVSELFGIEIIGCDDHDNHDGFHVKLETEDSAKNFEYLIAFDGEKWVIVDATISGNIINFTAVIKDFTAFAIVVSTADGDAPQTGDTFSWVYVALMVASAAGFVAVCVSMRKKKN